MPPGTKISMFSGTPMYNPILRSFARFCLPLSSGEKTPDRIIRTPSKKRKIFIGMMRIASLLNIRKLDKRYCTCSSHVRSEEHTSELQSRENLVCRLLLEKKKNIINDQ